jgi:exopolysaccharide biosynthesis polyprenyl glycosylphosphotransferase
MFNGGSTAAAGHSSTAVIDGGGGASGVRRIRTSEYRGSRRSPAKHRQHVSVPEAVVAAERVAPPVNPRRWMRHYQVGLVTADFTAAAVGAVGSYALLNAPGITPLGPIDVIFGVMLPFIWLAAAAFNRSYDSKIVGAGSAEFDRVFRAFLHTTVFVVFVAFAAHLAIARSYMLVSIATLLVLDLGLRYKARKRLHAARAAGRNVVDVVAVGGADAVVEFAERMRRDQYHGMRVIGACVVDSSPASRRKLNEADVAVLGHVDSLVNTIRSSGAGRVVVLASEVTPERLRWISWQMEEVDADLALAPGLTEVAGRRLHVQPISGLALLHVDQPQFSGFHRVVKGGFDRVVAAFLLVLLSPLLLTVAVAVRVSSPGPAFFRQRRIGINGSTFTVYKFRSMVSDAEERLDSLKDLNESDGLLFKMKHDPRITPIGAFIRKYSIDELPQLINVVKGEMSLVGPRPPLPCEVEQYGDDVRRRLLVKPGITGLWQISGRSDLSWEESVRLDLHYVENWSLMLDMLVLWKTVRTVLHGSGAY